MRRFDHCGDVFEFNEGIRRPVGNRSLSRRRHGTRPLLQRYNRRSADFEHGKQRGLDKIVLYEPEGAGRVGEMVGTGRPARGRSITRYLT